MSELLQIAASLRQLSDQELRDLIIARSVSSAGLRDFFDLAEAISNQKSINSAICALPRSLAIAMASMAAGDSTDQDAHRKLIKLGLADSTGLFFSVAEAFAALKLSARPGLKPVSNAEVSTSTISSECGLAAFETIQALTELVFDLEQRYVREVGKGNVGLPDIKRLANHVKKPNEYAREIFNLARIAGLMTLVDGRWQLGRFAPIWLNSEPKEQIRQLWNCWLGLVGESANAELIDALSSVRLTNTSGQLCEPIGPIFESVYPFADAAIGSKIASLETLTSQIGLSSLGFTAPWFAQVVGDEIETALAQIEMVLPTAGARLICQADLSLVSTGPLPIKVEIELRRFADIEMIGMASTYRLTPLSITHGLETGLTEQGIRSLLVKLSSAKLPQPIDYLIRETMARFGRLAVRSSGPGGSSRIESADPILLTEILNCAELKAFALFRETDGTIASRFETEILYFGLREAGYAAIRLDAKGQVISPLRAISAATDPVKTDSILEDVGRMRKEETKVGSELADDDIQRKIQLAIKNKARALVTVATNSGEQIAFTLEPVGIANGRLRAKDKKADIERTLPIASIISVSIT